MATEESQLMTKVMPNKTVGVNLQSSLSVESSSFSTIQDFARNCYTETSSNDSSSVSGTDVDITSFTPTQKTCLRENATNVTKLNKEIELNERKKQSVFDDHLPGVLLEGETESKNDDGDDDNILLKKQTRNVVLPDHTDFFARSAFPFISNAKGNEPSLGLTELSSTCSSLIANINLVKSKTEIYHKKQNQKLNVPLTSAKCLPNSNISLLHLKDDREINLSMPSSVYGTQLSNIEFVLTGLSLDKKRMDDEQICESEHHMEQQMVHLAGGSVNLVSGNQDDAQNRDSVCRSEEEKCSEKSNKQLEGKIDVISKVTDDGNYFSSQKQILETLQENHKNSIINYSSVLNTSTVQDNLNNLKLYNVQKTTKTQSLEQHISKLIAQNAVIVDTLNPIRPRHYVRHLSFSEPLNEREHRKSTITSKLRRFSEDLSSTLNNTPYLVNKSKLQIALMGQNDSGFIVNCKNLDSVAEHKDISASYPYNLNGMCYTISESEKSPFSSPVSSKSNVPEERDFVKPATSKTHYNVISNEKLLQLEDKFPAEFTGKLDKQHRKSESSIIKDLLLNPKHTRVSHSAVSSTEGKLTSQLNLEGLSKQKVNEIHSSLHICKFCNISFLSKDNLEAHQLHYCKLRNQSGTASKCATPTGFSLKEQPLLEKLNDSSLGLSYETSTISDDRLNTAGILAIKSFGSDLESWIPPLKQRKLSEPVLSKSHIENNSNRRRTAEFLRSDKGAQCIPSASGGWNSQMCGGKVQIFDEIGNKQTTLKSSIHNQTSLFTLLGVESRHSYAFSENSSWVTEGGKIKKSNKISSLPTVVVTISKPELNSGGTVMQVHSSMAAGGSSLCVQASSQAPLMATGSSEIAKWKNFQTDIGFATKLDLSPISKNVSNESERLTNLAEQSPVHCDTPKSLVIESPGTSPLSEMTECGSPSSTQSSTLSFGKQERSPVRKMGRSENRDFEFNSPLGKSLCVMSISTTMENANRKNSCDSSNIPLFCIPDGPSAVFNCLSVFSNSTTLPNTADRISLSDDKSQTISPGVTSAESSSDNAQNKCPNPSRPTFLPLKKGITLVGSTLISPETPRPKKSSIQLYLGGHAYTSLGLKCSTRSTFCCIYRPQPMYVPQDTDPKLSMYSNWQVVPSKEELLGMTPSQILGLYNSHQKKESCKAILTIAKMGNTLVCTHSSYWTFRMQDVKEDLQKHSKITEKASDQDITIEDKSQLDGLIVPVEISYVSTIESGLFVSKDQAKMDENSNPSLKENSHSEDTAEESCTSHSNAHSPDDTILSNPPKRARHSEGNCCTTDEGTYVRGRGWGKYICEECGIRCKKPSVLKKHIRTHTNLRPYKCYHCAFAFKTKGNLTKHMKSKAHFKKCIELGVVPVPTTVDDSQIDEEALDKQEKLDKDICPSLNTQEFEDGEEIDDDADESDHSDNEDDDDCNSDMLNLGERIREMKNLKEIEQTHSTTEKEFSTTRDMTEKEGEAAQSLLHLSTCNVSQSSQKKVAKSLSSGVLSADHNEDSQSSSVLGTEMIVNQNSSCITDFENAVSNPVTSKGMATLPIISSNTHRGSTKITSCTSFATTDLTYSTGQAFSENRSMERKSGNFENISPLAFRVTSPNSDYRERPPTMWTTTTPQSWHGHSSLSLFPNSHVKYQGKGMIWDGQLLDVGIPKPLQFVIDTDQPMDLRVSKTKDRVPEATSRLTSYEDWRLSHNVATDHLVRIENPKSNENLMNNQQDEEINCKSDIQGTQEQQISCVITDNLSPKPIEENNMKPIENIAVTKCQDSKDYAKPTGCHENSIPAYNVGRSESTFDAGANVQTVQYELPTKSIDDCVDSESQPACPISPISPPMGEDTLNHLPALFHENAAASSHSISKSDHGTSHRQKECLEKNGALRNSYVSEGKCTCAICNKTFTKPSQLRLHVNIHYFERPFRCDDCAISFRTNGHLEKHKRSASHYNKLHTNTSFGTPCADNPRPFKCSDCNIAFRMHGHLAKHLRSKMHIMKLECLGKLPFGMYAEMERTGVNFNDIDTTDCDNSLESLQEIAQHLYTPPNAQQSMDLTSQSVQTTKPKPHFLNSSYSSATSLQIINTSSSCYNSEIQQINPALNLTSLNNCNADRSRKLNHDKNLLAMSERANVECRTGQKEYMTEFSHLDASIQSSLHSRTCPCDSCISSKITSFSSLGDGCTSRPVKKEQWKLKDRLIAEFQEESTHMENPR